MTDRRRVAIYFSDKKTIQAEGFFMGIGTAFNEFETEAGNYTTAIVELDDGSIQMPPIEDIKFLDTADKAAQPDSKEQKLISQTTKMLNDHSKVLACICDTDSNENEYDHEFFICDKGESDGTVSGLDIKKMEDVAIWELSVEEAIKLGLKSIESIYNKPPERTTKDD